MSMIWRPGFMFDVDASNYIEAVEAADGQQLETAVRYAYNDLFIGCKEDGTFSALKACCIMAGARTLAGALTPLLSSMPAPTNVGFVAGDYNRKTGLGDPANTAKYLNSNRADNADPQNSIHIAVYKSSTSVGPANYYIGSGTSTHIRTGFHRSRNSILDTSYVDAAGFCGSSRQLSTTYFFRSGGSTTTVSAASSSASTQTHHVFKRADALGQFVNSPLAFYSIGESLNLALLDARVTTLMQALSIAIP
jgi:hypothetical protein